MPCTPQELKERLLKAIDQEHNVVDMPTVLDIFSILEKHPISREILEQTRMGLHVNEIRRKTENKDLAKRARSLLRGWQKLLHSSPQNTSTASTSSHVINGEGISGKRGALPGGVVGNGASGSKVSQLLAESKPASPASRPSTPGSGGRPSQSPLSYQASTLPSSRPGTPSAGGHYPLNPPSSTTSRLSPKVSSAIRPPTGSVASPALSAHSGGSQTSPGLSTPVSQQSQSKVGSQHLSSAATRTANSSSRPGTPTETLSKTNVANKRKRRAEADSPGSEREAKRPHNHPHPKNLATSCDTLVNSCEGSHQPPSTPSTGGGIKLTIKKDRTVNGLVSHTQVSIDGVDTSQNGTSLSSVDPYARLEMTRTPTIPRANSPAGAEFLGKQAGIASKRNASSLSLKTDFSERDTFVGDGGAATPRSLERTHSSASLYSSSKTPKVKTTAQLIKELHESGGLKLRSSETIHKIAHNQIEKEDDSDNVSVVPAGARPRPRKKPGSSSMLPPTPSDKTLSQTKRERIRKFLQTSVTPSPPVAPSPDPDLSTLLQLNSPLEPEVEPDVVPQLDEDDSFSRSRLVALETTQHDMDENGHSDIDMEVDEPARIHAPDGTMLLPERSKEEQEQFLQDPWSFLPPLDLNTADYEEEEVEISFSEVESRSIVTDTKLERLHEEEWGGVNGHYDYENYWHDWTRCYSMPSYQGHLLHILPYVNVDE